jgi:hypothetical protein
MCILGNIRAAAETEIFRIGSRDIRQQPGGSGRVANSRNAKRYMTGLLEEQGISYVKEKKLAEITYRCIVWHSGHEGCVFMRRNK